MNAVQLLVAGHDYLSDPDHWTRYNFGLDSRHIKCGTEEMADAVRCCAVGVLMKFDRLAHGSRAESKAYVEARDHLAKAFSDDLHSWASVTNYNDTIADHDGVLRLFKLAIARAEKEEASRGSNN